MADVTDRADQDTADPTTKDPAASAAESEDSSTDQPTITFTASQSKRLNAPIIGMVLSTLTVTVLVAGFYFLNPEPDYTVTRDEDVAEAALWTASVADFGPIAPELPESWTANYARWELRTETGVQVWEAGYTTDSEHFVGFAQTDEPNQAWINAEVRHIPQVGTVEVDGFTLAHHQDSDRQYYVLTEEENSVDDTTLVLGGDAEEEDLSTALSAALNSLGAQWDAPEEQDVDPAEVADPSDQ